MRATRSRATRAAGSTSSASRVRSTGSREKERLGARLSHLERRAALNAALRRFFAARSFVEIEAPLLVPAPGLELHLDAFAVAGGGYLITSPEYQMKRLLAGGMQRIYSLGKVFR